MTLFQEIKLMNETKIVYLKKLGINSQRNEIIRNVLEDDECFVKMDKSDAYLILKDVGIAKEKIESVYSTLIDKA